MHSGMKIFTCETMGAPPQINLHNAEALHILGPLSSFEAPFCQEKNGRSCNPGTESRGPQALQGT